MFQRITNKYHYSIILLRELVKTEFKLRYQGSALGYLWSLLKPLFLFVIMYGVFVYFLKVGHDVPHWPISMLFGLVLWNFFAELTNTGLTSVVDRGDVIRKINFPKYVIVFASGISAFINLLLSLIVLFIFMMIFGVDWSWGALVAPLFIIELFIFGMGVALILSTVYVKLRDINYIWEIIMQALFYGSAVIYPMSMVLKIKPILAKIMLLNPIAQSIQDARYFLISEQNMTMYTITHNLLYAAIPIIIALATFVLGAILFKKKSPYFAENI